MDESDREEVLRIAPVIIWKMPALLMRTFVSYLRIKRSARRAVRRFKRGLKEEGLPPEITKRLVRMYDENTSIFRRLASSAVNGFMFVPK